MVSRLGHSKDEIARVFWDLWKGGMEFESVEEAVQKVRNAMEREEMQFRQTTERSGVDINMVSRLKEVVAIPSIVDVCNGLYRWYYACSENEVWFSPFVFPQNSFLENAHLPSRHLDSFPLQYHHNPSHTSC